MRSHFWTGFCILFLAGLIGGCSRAPQLSTPNRKILEALQTAVSSKNTEWLDATVKLVEEKRQQKEMSDAEFASIDRIIQKARSGDWKSAQVDSFALSGGQRATSDDLAMLKQRKSSKAATPN